MEEKKNNIESSKLSTSSGKLKGHNRCTMRRGRHIDLTDSKSPVLEKASIQKSAIKAFFTAKKFSQKIDSDRNFETKLRYIYKRFLRNGISTDLIPEEFRAEARSLKRILHLYDDNTSRWSEYEIAELVKKACEITKDKSGEREIPVIKNYIYSGFKSLGDFTNRTARLQGKKAYARVRRYLLSEKRLPFIPSETMTLDMFGIIDVEERPDLVFFGENGKSIEAVKICCKKPDVSQTGRVKDKAAMQSMELFSKLQYAKNLINDNRIHDIKGSFYFLGRKDDKGSEFEEDFFAYRGGNIVSLTDTSVYSEEAASVADKMFFPEKDSELLGKIEEHFKPQFEEYAEGELCSGTACEHCDFEDLCNYTPAPLNSKVEKAKKSVRDINLSREQEAAVNFRKGIGRINAVAGCGKTLIVALRTAFMLSEGVKPEEILLITFTNAGAAEMKERIAMYDEDLMTDSDLSKLTCTTFNSFGDMIVKKEYESLGFTEEPRLIDDIERKELITQLLNIREIEELNYEFFDMKNAGALAVTERAFSEIKKNRLSLYDLNKLKELMDPYLRVKESEKEGICKSLLILYEHYDAILKERNLIEYSDQEALLFDLLDQDPYYFEENFGFKHLIIDEFQDSATCSSTSPKRTKKRRIA